MPTFRRGRRSLPGLGDHVSVTAYGGDPSWTGLALISGRWYSHSSDTAEVVVNTLFLTDTGTSVGSTYTLASGGHRATVRIVGEVFRPGNDVDIYLSPATLATVDPSAGVQQYAVALRPGTNGQPHANALSAALGNSYYISTSGGGDTQLIAAVTLIATLTILITVVAGLGVRNTVAPADPGTRSRHRRVQGHWHDPPADPRDDRVLGRPRRPGRRHRRGARRGVPPPRRAPDHGARRELRCPPVPAVGSTRRGRSPCSHSPAWPSQSPARSGQPAGQPEPAPHLPCAPNRPLRSRIGVRTVTTA